MKRNEFTGEPSRFLGEPPEEDCYSLKGWPPKPVTESRSQIHRRLGQKLRGSHED